MMGLLFPNVFLEIIFFIIMAVFVFYKIFTKDYNYWKDRGVPHKKAEFPFGSMKDVLLTRTIAAKGLDVIYKQFHKERYYGITDFIKPVLVVKDPELIKKILIKDFDHFVNRESLLLNPNEYITNHLVNLQGQEWKALRSKLTPTFTSGKLKLMFPLMEKGSEQLYSCLIKKVEDGTAVDAKNVLSRFTMDMIASCAFGLDSNVLADENATFYRILAPLIKMTKVDHVIRLIFTFFPVLPKVLRINTLKPEVKSFVYNVVCDTIKYRQLNNVERNDFLNLFINANPNRNVLNKETGNDDQKCDTSNGLTLEQIVAQTFLFFIAGYETSSSIMTFCLFEISRHHHIQQMLFQQLQKAVQQNNGKLSYQLLMEVSYLDQVINETLRLYGVSQMLQRVCDAPYKIPDSNLVVEKGVKVVVPVYSIHHDPQYYPDPDEFKPERFSPEETKKRHPLTFLPFGEGPRHCMGMRFALLQAKVGIATVILNFQVDLSPDQELPIEIHPRALVITPAKPVLLKLKKRIKV